MTWPVWSQADMRRAGFRVPPGTRVRLTSTHEPTRVVTGPADAATLGLVRDLGEWSWSPHRLQYEDRTPSAHRRDPIPLENIEAIMALHRQHGAPLRAAPAAPHGGPPPAPAAPQRPVSAPVYANPERVTPAGPRDHATVDHRRPVRPEYTALADRVDPAVWRPDPDDDPCCGPLKRQT